MRVILGRTDQPEYICKDTSDDLLLRRVLSIESVVAEAICDGAGDRNNDRNEM